MSKPNRTSLERRAEARDLSLGRGFHCRGPSDEYGDKWYLTPKGWEPNQNGKWFRTLAEVRDHLDLLDDRDESSRLIR